MAHCKQNRDVLLRDEERKNEVRANPNLLDGGLLVPNSMPVLQVPKEEDDLEGSPLNTKRRSQKLHKRRLPRVPENMISSEDEDGELPSTSKGHPAPPGKQFGTKTRAPRGTAKTTAPSQRDPGPSSRINEEKARRVIRQPSGIEAKRAKTSNPSQKMPVIVLDDDPYGAVPPNPIVSLFLMQRQPPLHRETSYDENEAILEGLSDDDLLSGAMAVLERNGNAALRRCQTEFMESPPKQKNKFQKRYPHCYTLITAMLNTD